MTQKLIDEIPDDLREFMDGKVGGEYIPIFYKVLDTEYVKIAHSRYWDTPTAYVVFRLDDAHSGVIIVARYPRVGWRTNPSNCRDLARLMLGMLGVELPMPSMREES